MAPTEEAKPETDAQMSQLSDITQASNANAAPLQDVMSQLKLERATQMLKRVLGVQGSSDAEVLDAACNELGVSTSGLRDFERVARCFKLLRLDKELETLGITSLATVQEMGQNKPSSGDGVDVVALTV